MEIDQVVHGDALTVLRTFPNEIFDAVIADPPYGIDYQCHAKPVSTGRRLPKIANDERPFIWWLYDAFRTTKDGGSLLCFCSWRHQEVFRQAIELAGYTVRSQIIWDRGTHGMGDLTKAFAPQHDPIWFATKGNYTFPGKRPISVVRAMRVPVQSLAHPNEKPVSLMRQLVTSVTAREALILDPFSGSGATCEAALREDRHYLGIELDPGYAQQASERTERVRQQPLLQTPLIA